MGTQTPQGYQEYWDKNIERWADLYLEISHGHEELRANKFVSKLYNLTIAKYESRLMRDRYMCTMNFISQYVHEGTTVSDIGCGTGIFVVQALLKGAKVNAIDFSESALKVTKKNIEKNAPQFANNVTYHRLNAEKQNLPKSDVAFAIGVTPYIRDLKSFYANILSSTDLFYCLVVDSAHWANKVRTVVPALNVRDLCFYSREYVDGLLTTNAWDLVSRKKFATGFLDLAKSKRSLN